MLSARAWAIDTSTCGYLACEASHAAGQVSGGRCDSAPPYGRECECRLSSADGCPGYPGQRVCLVRITLSPGVPASPAQMLDYWGSCACSAQPPISGDGGQFANAQGKMCVGGCRYEPKPLPGDPAAGVACTPFELVAGSKLVCTSAGGWYAPGTNCNPLDPDEPAPVPEPSGTKQCREIDGVGETCITPIAPPPPDIPKLCPEVGGEALPCISPPECKESSSGVAVCAGNPAPEPPPAEPPMQRPPPVVSFPSCTGQGSCSPVTVNVYPPEVDNSDHNQTCPDGSHPVNGSCAAPPGRCADGSTPVAGKCPAASDGDGHPGSDNTCSNGTPPQAGHCYDDCPDGSRPVMGLCPAPAGTCPNGSAPTDGRCRVGEPCTGESCGDGNAAGGGGTCRAPPFCSGDQILCASLHQTWESRCAVDRLGSALNPAPPSDGDYGPEYGAGDAWAAPGDENGPELDDSGWLGARSCPAMPQVQFMGHSYDVGEWIPCSALSILSLMILLGGYAQAAYIIGRA